MVCGAILDKFGTQQFPHKTEGSVWYSWAPNEWRMLCMTPCTTYIWFSIYARFKSFLNIKCPKLFAVVLKKQTTWSKKSIPHDHNAYHMVMWYAT